MTKAAATPSVARGRRVRRAALCGFAGLLAACGDGGVALVPVAYVSLSTSSVAVVPGQTLQLTATVQDASGNTLNGRAVSWASSDQSKVRVDATGVITGVALGVARITATSQGKSADAEISVLDGGMITPGEGGTVNFENAPVTFVAPPGAVLQPTPVVVYPVTSYPPDARVVAGSVFGLNPLSLVLGQPATLTITYSPSGIGNGSPEFALGLYRSTGAGWQPVPGSQVDTAANTVSAPIPELWIYAVLGR